MIHSQAAKAMFATAVFLTLPLSTVGVAQTANVTKDAALALRCIVSRSADNLGYAISIVNDTDIYVPQNAPIRYLQGRANARYAAKYVLPKGIGHNEGLSWRAPVANWTEGECYAWVSFVKAPGLSGFVAQ